VSDVSESVPQGRFDVHSHVLPGIDDGCDSLGESIQCARELVAAGYTHSFCTPHFWPNLVNNTVESVRRWTSELQSQLTAGGIPLKLFPGGEINLQPRLMDSPIADLPTFNMQGKYTLVDMWADKLPKFFEPTIRWMQSAGLTVILAHPERMRAVQLDPDIADHFTELGILLQGNLQCLGDPPHAATRSVAEKYLLENRYFLLGMDLHNPTTLPVRFAGLRRAIELVGNDAVDRLTITNPRKLVDNA
jgi:protein-tyrosine phosphatase